MPKLIQSRLMSTRNRCRRCERTVEFRCRLASPNGEIVEGVYVADSEARLRHELEEKGLFVLSLQPKGAIAGVSLQLPQRNERHRRASFWSSTRSWRRC